jgi:hypothetical protein
MGIDEEIKNGPIEKRECQDLLCCLLFIINAIVMGSIAISGYVKGYPSRLVAAYDSDGNTIFFKFKRKSLRPR